MSAPADTLRRAIAAHQLSYAEAAARLEIHETYLSDILNRQRPISAYLAVRAEMVLGIDSRKLIIDQALMEYERAKMDAMAAQKATA